MNVISSIYVINESVSKRLVILNAKFFFRLVTFHPLPKQMQKSVIEFYNGVKTQMSIYLFCVNNFCSSISCCGMWSDSQNKKKLTKRREKWTESVSMTTRIIRTATFIRAFNFFTIFFSFFFVICVQNNNLLQSFFLSFSFPSSFFPLCPNKSLKISIHVTDIHELTN